MVPSKPFNAYIFFSHQDGTPFVQKLQHKLQQDERASQLRFKTVRRGNISGEGNYIGKDEWEQANLPNTLSQIECLLQVITPALLQTRHAQQAWQFAHDIGLPCLLVKGDVPIDDYDKWPFNEKSILLYDLEKDWEMFVTTLYNHCHLKIPVFMAPAIPRGYVQRPGIFEAVKNQILGSKGKRENYPIALTGEDGSGKTTLAIALCHDEEIQKSFPDGILWIAIREDKDALTALTELYSIITGEKEAFFELAWASDGLARLLARGDFLLVLDGVNEYHQVAPFLKDSLTNSVFPNFDLHTVRLITTPNEKIVHYTQAVPFPVAGMEKEEALQILLGEEEVIPDVKAISENLVNVLQSQPLFLQLIKQAASASSDKIKYYSQSLDFLLKHLPAQSSEASFPNGVAGGITQGKNQIIEYLLENSLRWLTPFQIKLCLSLGTLFRNESIPLQVISSLWRTTESVAEAYLQQLAAYALLGYDQGRVTIHPVLFAYYQFALGNKALHYHQILVSGWSDLNDLPEVYGWHFYLAHLISAGQDNKAEQLLSDFNWLQNKLRYTSIQAVLEDYQRFSRRAPGTELIYKALLLSKQILSAENTNLAIQIKERLQNHLTELPFPFLAALEKDLQNSIWKPISAPYFLVGSLINSLPQDSIIYAIIPWREYFVMGMLDGSIKVIQKLSGKIKYTIVNPEGSVVRLAIKEDILVSGGVYSQRTGGFLKTWDLPTGNLLHDFGPDIGPITSLAIWGDTLISGSNQEEQSLRSWNLHTGELKQVFAEHTSNVYDLALVGDILVSGSSDDILRGWNLSTGKLLYTKPVNAHWITSIGVEGNVVVCSCNDGILKSWDLLTGKLLINYKGHTRSIDCITINNGILASYGAEGKIITWDLYTGKQLNVFRDYLVECLLISGDTLISGGGKGLKTRELSTGKLIYDYTNHHITYNSVNQLLLMNDIIVTSGEAGRSYLNFWELNARVEQPRHGFYDDYNYPVYQYLKEIGFEYKGPPNHTEKYTAVGIFEDELYDFVLISGSEDKTMISWDLKTGKPIQVFTGHQSRISCFYKKGNILISGSGDPAKHAMEVEGLDTSVRSWEFSSGKPLQVFRGHTRGISCVGLSGNIAVSGSGDGTIRSWDLVTGKALHIITGHQGRVTSLIVEGNLIISSGDRTIRFWDLQRGKSISCIYADEEVMKLAFNRNSSSLTGTGNKGGLYKFQVNIPVE